jgi:ribosomal protein S21
MPRIRSAKGAVVDFDLLKIKNQMAKKPISVDVKAREAFIDAKQKRPIRKAKAAVAPVEVESELDDIGQTEEQPIIETTEAKKVDEVHVQQHNVKQKMRPPK